MSDFVNTVDLVGDDALIDSIIDRSITEIRDNRLTIVSYHAFWGCRKLAVVDLPRVTRINAQGFRENVAMASVNLPLVTEIAGYAFYNNGIPKIDFPSLTKIENFAFSNCPNLKTVILRGATVCSLGGASVFPTTPIVWGTGYIYVPRALLDDYKSATNWSTYAAQFRALEDYTVDGTTTGELDPTKI